jgi:hypothetical protein
MGMKFTFKRHKKETGLRGVGYPNQSSDIKLDGKIVGTIAAPNWQTTDNLWCVRLTIKKDATSEEPCAWKWITLKFRGKDEAECQKFILDNSETLIKFNLHAIYET